MSTPSGDSGEYTAALPTNRSIGVDVAPEDWTDTAYAVPADVWSETTFTQPTRVGPDRDAVVGHRKERFGGMKAGTAFLGWLTATGTTVVLIVLLAAAGMGFGLVTAATADQAVAQAAVGTGMAKAVGLIGGIVLLVILFVSYFCGGYVAGRMARFNGVKQGLAVWIWGIVMVLVVVAITAMAGTKFSVLQLNLPRLPVGDGNVTLTAIIAIAAGIAVALIGALLGGRIGMHYHLRVDAEGFRDEDVGSPRIRR